MPSFLTQCPHCLTSFRVTDSQLEAAEGLVRCGACLGIFSAAANRITLKLTPEEAPPPEPADEEIGDSEEDEDDFDAGTAAEVPEEFAPVPDADPVEYRGSATTSASMPEPAAEEFIAPAELEDELDEEPEPLVIPPRMAEPPAPAAQESDEASTEPDEFEIELGDLNLDAGLEEEEGEEGEEALDEDDEFEDESGDAEDQATALEEEYEEDEVDEGEVDDDELDEEYVEEDAYDENEGDEGDEEDEDEEDEYLDEDEEEEDSEPAPPPRVARATTDKRELHRYLANIEDDEALEPIDDEALDYFEEEPVVFDTAPRRSRLVTAALVLGGIVLAGLLIAQYMQANIERLSRSAGFASFLPYACRVLACPAAERSQLDLLVTEQLLVRSHPRYAQALEVNLVFRNDAAEAQPFPALELGFHDTSNRLLANRLFQPAEYLPPELRTSEMPARSSLQVQLEMVDPGSEAVNYTLVFREP